MQPLLSRRRALLAVAGLTLVPEVSGAAGAAVRLVPDGEQDLFRVRVELETDGHIELPRRAGGASGEGRRLRLKSDSALDYEERWTRDGRGVPVAARRFYSEAESRGTIHRRSQQLGIRDEARRVEVRLDGARSVAHGLQTQLTAEELDLLGHPGSSLAVDRLLPPGEVRPEDSWSVGDQALAQLFDLDAVQDAEVEGRLVSVEGNRAKAEYSGRLAGSVDGVPTSLRLAAKLTFDLQERAVTWLALSIREQREIGKAEPGFDVSAQVRLTRRRLSQPSALEDTAPVAIDRPVAPDKLLVDVRGRSGFSALCDRRWRVTADAPRLTVLRMIDADRVVAQCEVRPLAALEPGEQLTLEAFQHDIRAALASRFGEFVEAEERATSAGVRVLRAVVNGSVDEVPVQWDYVHLSDDSGRRTSATFTHEASQSEVFGASGVQFASSFQFVQPEAADAEEPATETAEKEDGAARASKR